MFRLVYLNGRFVEFKHAKISIEDRGFQFSDSIYEVIATKYFKPIDFNYHLIRLKNSLRQIDIKYSISKNKLHGIIKRLVKKNKIECGLIYIQITRGIQSREHVYKDNLKPTVVIYTLKKNFNDNLNKLDTKSAITLPDIRWKRRDIKSTSLLPNILAAKAAARNKAYESIFIENGYVTEGTSSNIWIVKNDVLMTHPPSTNILRGITRDSIIRLIKKNGLKLVEKKFKKNLLFKADEVFLTSSSSFVTPIVKIDKKLINKGKIGIITYKLAELYKMKIK